MPTLPTKEKLSKRDTHHLQALRQRTSKAIERYELLIAGDTVLVAISGGKDSYALLEILAFQKRHLKLNINIYAVHIKVTNTPYKIDLDYAQSLCTELAIPLSIIPLELDRSQFDEKSPCYICSAARRKLIFQEAERLQCHKIAFGHNRDDAIETALMNLTYLGNFATMPPSLAIFDGATTIIRPLYLCTEKELSRYGRILQFPAELAACPYEKTNKRDEIKKLLQSMERLHSQAADNIFRSLSHISTEYLPPQEKGRPS